MQDGDAVALVAVDGQMFYNWWILDFVAQNVRVVVHCDAFCRTMPCILNWFWFDDPHVDIDSRFGPMRSDCGRRTAEGRVL